MIARPPWGHMIKRKTGVETSTPKLADRNKGKDKMEKIMVKQPEQRAEERPQYQKI